MSSRSPTRPDAWRAVLATLLVLVATQPLAAAPAAAAVPLPVTAVLSRDGQTALVVDLSASTRPGKRTVTVTAGGVRQRAELVPVMSGGLAVALVVDTSTAGAASLPAWLSAGARFILEAPAGCQAVVIADRRPAAAITPPLRGPTEIIRALTAVRADGDRDTAAALTLATRQFPQAGTGHRVVIMYTTAANAGDLPAATLAARFRAGGTILVVVGTAGDAYWSDAAAATGGFFAPAGQPVVVPALDQVESTLSGRFLIRFATPAALPARVSVKVDTGDLTLTGDAVIPPPQPAAAPDSATSRTLLWSVIITMIVATVAALTLLLVLRARRPRVPLGPPALTSVFRGHAAVAAPVARGRAPLPHGPGPATPSIGPGAGSGPAPDRPELSAPPAESNAGNSPAPDRPELSAPPTESNAGNGPAPPVEPGADSGTADDR